ncbi:hypothetical protein HaLaN_15466 [Haematococcus lacustris]|uniref:Uncharacterized protein n=1 Tax=Haematococcus lacustris TaxID=44745 RepID=A0A699Z8X1_HAELA|nr:hypothetical protein HaLaN_15466 [Haematococcus lacustris]
MEEPEAKAAASGPGVKAMAMGVK